MKTGLYRGPKIGVFQFLIPINTWKISLSLSTAYRLILICSLAKQWLYVAWSAAVCQSTHQQKEGMETRLIAKILMGIT